MWPRLFEAALGAWLAASPLVLGSASGGAAAHDVAVGALVAVLALASLARRRPRTHLLEVPVALWLAAFGWMRYETPPLGVAQNHLLLGLVLLMSAVLPTDASRPPAAWREGVDA
jgi:hypothetical protein